jgi:hypothetical protein
VIFRQSDSAVLPPLLPDQLVARSSPVLVNRFKLKDVKMSKLATPFVLLAVFAAGIAVGQVFTTSNVLHAQSDKRVFELRTYTAPEGKLSELHARFRNHTTALFQQHGITNIGYWVPQDAPQKQNTLVYMIAYPNREEAKKRWAEFQADPVWKKALTESQVNGPLQNKVESIFLDPLDFSPLK